MDKSFKVAGLGEVLWDVFPEGEAFGGAPANFACHCRSLGAEAYVLSAVGDDARGAKARQFLSEHGVDISGLAVLPEHETGVVLVSLDARGKPEYDIKEGVAWDHVPASPVLEEIASQLDALCFGSLAQRSECTRATVEACLAATRSDCLRVFDINLRQSYYSEEVVRASLSAASALKLSDEELPLLAGMFSLQGAPEAQLRALLEMCELRLAVLTCGPEGAWMMTPDEQCFVAPPDDPVVNTVGAGDSFTAAAVVKFLRGAPLEEINRYANLVATYVCTQHGAVPALPAELLQS